MTPEALLHSLRQRQRTKQAKDALQNQSRLIYRGVVTQLRGDKILVSINGASPIACTSLGGAFVLGEVVTVRVEDGVAYLKKLEAR